ncbi:inositol monophosphatase protein (plasmid) [Rhizobium etli 8C-3]|uniref:Inositol monophosphatase protein n=1 Tax=Rhizobium etli 8C-3 TaxID=538025 RepID=A0A1L5PAI2_RHIET|nr:inositol monophosphatase [Rhizobium etli]APO77207.1 inositol monophosphatase protein [Rhizobium etli 8C-3]
MKAFLPQVIIDGLIDAVRDTARREIMPRFRNLRPGAIDTKSAPDDLVTEADRAAERAITDAVRVLLPAALVVGEEAAFETPGLLDELATAEMAVIVDPVDGTWNFANGLAVFGVILAVTIRGETVFGLLYDPVMDDWIVAERGRGAWYCRPGKAPVRCPGPSRKPLGESHGVVPLFLFPKEQQAGIAACFQKINRVSALRCSCHEYRMMALGSVDFILSPMAKPWDHAAGLLVIEECGGQVISGQRCGYAPGFPQMPLIACGHGAEEIQAIFFPWTGSHSGTARGS